MGRPDAPPSPPYRAEAYDLRCSPAGARRALTPLRQGDAEVLGRAFAAIDPWAAYCTPPSRLAAFFGAEEPDVSRRAICLDGRLAGAVVIRSPWLHGPYLQFLGVLPGDQGHGIGGAVLDWIAAEAPSGTRNLWLCVSAINARARGFYERHGYELVAELPALAADHMVEHLMRRRLAVAPPSPLDR